MSFKDILLEVQDGIATITLNRPEVMNAARRETYDELIDALGMADADPAVRAVIVTGNGRVFCPGADISGGFREPHPCDPATGQGCEPDRGGRVSLKMFEMRKPVIGAINGAAAGFGATFTLAMDYRLLSSKGKYLFPFCRRAIAPEGCSSWFLPRLVGPAKALDWMMSGRAVLPDEALNAGLISEVVEPDALIDRAREIAATYVHQTAPVSVALTRRLVWQMLGAAHPKEAHILESRAVNVTLAMPDVKEGGASFREKRAPSFTSTADDAAFMDSWWSD